MIRRSMLALTSLLAAAACSTATPATPSATPSTPPATSSAVEAPSRSAQPHTSADLRRADPCGFFDAEALGTFGKLTVERDTNYYSCTGTVDTADGGSVNLSLQVESTRSGSPDEKPVKIGGLTVYREPGDVDLCTREVMAKPDVVISFYASQDPKPQQPCAVADALTTSVVDAVRKGAVPAVEYPADSLAWRDACTLLTAAEAKAPGAVAQKHPAFGGHSCVWGTDDVTEPSVFVQLAPGEPVDGTTKIAGHTVSVLKHPANEHSSIIGSTLAACEVNADYQALQPAHQNWVEGLTVTVTAGADPGSLCPKAKELATKVIARLSA